MLLFATTLLASAQNVGNAFDNANKLYEQGRFSEAAAAYEQLIQTGNRTPAIFYNLGNARLKAGDLGRAIANYRRAQQLTPRDPDLRANLQFARNQVQGPTLRPNPWQRTLNSLTLNEWTGLAAGALWLVFGLLAFRQFRPASARALRSWTFFAGLVAVALCICLGLAWSAQTRQPVAIITVEEATIRNGPIEDSPRAFTANDGAELRIVDRKNDWLQVTDGTRQPGWVKGNSLVVFP